MWDESGKGFEKTLEVKEQKLHWMIMQAMLEDLCLL